MPASFGTSVRSRSIRAYDRLDAAFYSSSSIQATETIALLEASGVEIETIGSLGAVSMPARTALVRAAPSEEAIPYLRPYDVFDYLPVAADRVSVARNPGIDGYRIRRGTILQTRSGRNLGPCTLADEHLADFALSDDMIRIAVEDEVSSLILLCYLKTSLGQALIRRGRSGSVIDHLTVADVEAVPVPVLPEALRQQVWRIAQESVERRRRGRADLKAVLGSLNDRYVSDEHPGWVRWSMRARDCRDRLDAGHHHPTVRSARGQLESCGGIRLGDLAKAILPVRYKRYYVGEGHGRRILSGRQLLQPEPINLRYVSDRSFRNTADYEVGSGFTIFGAVGRSEGRQAWPALVTEARAGWLASNDVMRLVPRASVRPGALWLAVALPQVQAQIKALSFGSVIDHMNPWDVEDVVVPVVEEALAARAEQAWEDLDRSASLIGDAVLVLEKGLDQLAELTG